MIEECRVGFFKIDRCGYYNAGPKPVVKFGDIGSILRQIKNWSSGKTLVQTKVFESGDDDALPVYLYDIQEMKGDWLLTFWNQVPASENTVPSVMANSNVGSAKVHMNKVEPGSIPGFATYFWFVPEKNVFANLRFQHLVVGHSSLKSYIKGFLERNSDHVVYSDEVDAVDIEIIGYRENASSEVLHLHPRYSSSPYVKPGEHKYLISNFKDIRRVCRRTTLSLSDADDLALWQIMWRRIKGAERAIQVDEIQCEYDIKTPVSKEEVEEIIKISETETETWDDIGFVLTGESSSIRWLSKSYARDKIKLDVVRQNDEVVEAESLLKALNSSRHVLLKLLES